MILKYNTKPFIKKLIVSSIGILVAILLFLAPGLKVPIIDQAADKYFNESIAKAGLVYATCRVINASVSVVKDTTLNLEPAGVGITLAVGQALDPIDDMTERMSTVIVMAITSLGVQKLAYEITLSILPPIIAVLLIILSLFILFKHEKLMAIQRTVISFIVLLFVARMALPISAVMNNYIQEDFFSPKISTVNKDLAATVKEFDKLMEFSLPEIDGVLGTIKNSTSFLMLKSHEFKKAIVSTARNTGKIIDNLLKLTFLYVGIFLIQVIALPLIVFWLLVKIANGFFDNPRISHFSLSMQELATMAKSGVDTAPSSPKPN